jgi:hypothetical protein
MCINSRLERSRMTSMESILDRAEIWDFASATLFTCCRFFFTYCTLFYVLVVLFFTC